LRELLIICFSKEKLDNNSPKNAKICEHYNEKKPFFYQSTKEIL